MAETKKKNSAYNPYSDVKGVSENKGLWGTAKATGGDANQYHYAAAPHYQNLIDNGYGDLANELSNTDYGGSLEILKRYQPTNGIEEYYNTLAGLETRKNTAGLDPTSSQWQNVAQDYLASAQNPKASETAQSIFDAFNSTNGLLNGELKYDSNGNVISGLNTDHYNSGRNQLDYLNNFDVTEQSYYDGIMAQYNNLGNDAANRAMAGTAASNSGNIDSFAQANANRQQIAYTTAGIQQALAAANQNQANWQNVYNSMTDHLANMGMLNNQVLEQAANIYATDSAERQNALNNAATLAGTEMQNNMQWYNNLLNYDLQTDINNVNAATGLYTNDVNNEHDSWKTQYTTEAAAAEAEKDRQNQITLQTMQNEYDTAARAEEKAAEEQAAKQAEAGNNVIRFVYNAVNDYHSNPNSSYKGLQDVYTAAFNRFPGYDYLAIQDALTQAESDWKSNNSVVEEAGKTVVEANDEASLFAQMAYEDFVAGTDPNLSTLANVIAVVQNAYGLTYQQAKSEVMNAMSVYNTHVKNRD